MLKEFDIIHNKSLSETCCLKWAEMVPELLKLDGEKLCWPLIIQRRKSPQVCMCSKHDQAQLTDTISLF